MGSILKLNQLLDVGKFGFFLRSQVVCKFVFVFLFVFPVNSLERLSREDCYYAKPTAIWLCDLWTKFQRRRLKSRLCLALNYHSPLLLTQTSNLPQDVRCFHFNLLTVNWFHYSNISLSVERTYPQYFEAPLETIPKTTNLETKKLAIYLRTRI